jgi:methylase of polypeptide subunit release factors
MHLPYQSDQHLSALAGMPLEYDRSVALQPDVVTESLAHLAAGLINAEPLRQMPISVLEVGVGVAPFLAWVADGVNPDIPLNLEGVDIDSGVVTYANHNVHRALSRKNNAHDTVYFREGDWEDSLAGGCYDLIYFNPPYLPEGEVVREEYRQAPKIAMYVDGSKDGLDHYRHVMPLLRSALSADGKLVIRTPDGADRAGCVQRIARAEFGDEATFHEVFIESEMGERSGQGLVVDKAKSEPVLYEFKPIRAVGFGVVHRRAVA